MTPGFRIDYQTNKGFDGGGNEGWNNPPMIILAIAIALFFLFLSCNNKNAWESHNADVIKQHELRQLQQELQKQYQLAPERPHNNSSRV